MLDWNKINYHVLGLILADEVLAVFMKPKAWATRGLARGDLTALAKLGGNALDASDRAVRLANRGFLRKAGDHYAVTPKGRIALVVRRLTRASDLPPDFWTALSWNIPVIELRPVELLPVPGSRGCGISSLFDQWRAVTR